MEYNRSKTKKNHPDISSEMQKIDFRIPDSWINLTNKELKFIYKALDVASDQTSLKVMLLLHINKIKIFGKSDNMYSILWKNKVRYIECLELQLAVTKLKWIDTPPTIPIAPMKIAGIKIKDKQLRKLKFGEWLSVDNLFIGFMATENKDLLKQIILIITKKNKVKQFAAEDAYAIFFWILGIKSALCSQFPTLFPKIKTEGSMKTPEILAKEARESTNGMLRALTKADVTKESAVMDVLMYRAFEELEALAKESEELKRQSSKNK